MKWPTEVPVLTARDICRGKFANTKGRRCLSGWCREVFSGSTLYHAAETSLRAETNKPITWYNDDARNSKAAIARAWNRAMARLGYVIDNPEA